jgi:anti-sigma-K factor RskA
MNCPNPDLLSAFFDGEVESPWLERIRKHVDDCERCQGTLAEIERLSRALHEDQVPRFEESLERTRERLKSSSHVAQVWRKLPFWRTRISVPLPAVAAMLVLFLGMGGILIFFSTRPNFPFMSIKREPSGVTEVQVAAPIEDLEQLLRSLDREAVNQEIIINLPEDTEFLQFSEPKMLRADEYSRRQR